MAERAVDTGELTLIVEALKSATSSQKAPTRPIRWRDRPAVQKISVWLLAVVVVSVLPLLMTYVQNRDAGRSAGLVKLLAHGDLMLIGFVISIATVGDLALAKVSDARRMFKALDQIFLVILALSQAWWYSDISAKTLDEQQVADPGFAAYSSLVIFSVCVLVCALGIKFVAEE